MRQLTFPPASSTSAAGVVRRGSARASPWTVNQRLGNAERELRVQFTRIAQLQAQLDVVLYALGRSAKGLPPTGIPNAGRPLASRDARSRLSLTRRGRTDSDN
jgi:hypothetical protein